VRNPFESKQASKQSKSERDTKKPSETSKASRRVIASVEYVVVLLLPGVVVRLLLALASLV
jgi:hypothetical protein